MTALYSALQSALHFEVLNQVQQTTDIANESGGGGGGSSISVNAIFANYWDTKIAAFN